ncbi:HPr family phosphocarrier protein [Halanaerobium sp. Z-7514]|uniref:Phosphocarrier protein HPr n=1 Tax=Halanaerobium polyolivorans TaxID=2886943 RepID=A0AAW4X1Y3_9FIRM|nr:HPr family phosphocarrier protein [Halanaerobium polyolivorans]MCC3145754.1 HPr family phosphocarrier protein [Halanaerobium polyolivorans]
MKVLEMKLENKSGLHARPASQFVAASQSFEANIEVEKKGQTVNGKSIMSLMTLGASYGDSIKVKATGSDEEEALKKLKNLIKTFK